MNKYERVRQYFQNILFSAAKSEEYGVNQTGISEINTAIEALDKQIPERVIFGDDEQDDIICPVCKFELAAMDAYEYEKHYFKYCPYCGQKLKWCDTE